MKTAWFIPIDVPSSKNSKQIVMHGKKRLIISSAVTQAYKRKTGIIYRSYAREFRSAVDDITDGENYPVHVEFYFVRKTLRKFDYINMAQIVQDMMVAAQWLPDDNCDYIIPVFAGHEKDSKNPGVRIKLII
jgi:hypothetical protein